MPTRKKYLAVATISTLLILMTGCVTVRQSKVPTFLQRLNSLDFDVEQRELIGDMLHYINDLENE